MVLPLCDLSNDNNNAFSLTYYSRSNLLVSALEDDEALQLMLSFRVCVPWELFGGKRGSGEGDMATTLK